MVASKEARSENCKLSNPTRALSSAFSIAALVEGWLRRWTIDIGKSKSTAERFHSSRGLTQGARRAPAQTMHSRLLMASYFPGHLSSFPAFTAVRV